MAGSINLGRFFGIEVKLHYSWFFIFALLAWALSTGFFLGPANNINQKA